MEDDNWRVQDNVTVDTTCFIFPVEDEDAKRRRRRRQRLFVFEGDNWRVQDNVTADTICFVGDDNWRVQDNVTADNHVFLFILPKTKAPGDDDDDREILFFGCGR
jgi:hypothetical protein